MKPDLHKIKNHIPRLIGEDKAFKAAVCIPLIEAGSGTDILFQVRSANIPDQPGDVCLPGGEMEKGETPEDAAVRECCEELLIDRSQIEVIGASDILHSENLIVYPFVGTLKDYDFTFSAREVSEVFTVPFEYFLDNEPEVFMVDSVASPREDFPFHRIEGGRNYKWRERSHAQLFYEYDGHTIWGLTARIINAFFSYMK